MALKIKDGKVISISPPTNLTKKQMDDMENAPVNTKFIKEAMATKFNIVYNKNC